MSFLATSLKREINLKLVERHFHVEVISGAPPWAAALSVKSEMKLDVESLKLISPSLTTHREMFEIPFQKIFSQNSRY